MIKKSTLQKITKRESQIHKVRFSKTSVEKLADVVNDIGNEIASHAKTLAEHAKRNTVTEKDVKLVLK